MVKIKRKVEVTQEEYAKYMIDKYGVSGFESSLIDDNIIDAPKRLTLVFELNSVSKSDLFNGSFRNGKLSVEVEEEITENTILEKAIEVYSDEHDCFMVNSYKEKSIKEILGTNIDGYTKTKNIYLFNNDESITLIWTREKGLVE